METMTKKVAALRFRIFSGERLIACLRTEADVAQYLRCNGHMALTVLDTGVR